MGPYSLKAEKGPCDGRVARDPFLLLAQQEFRHLGPRAKFFRFLAIGTDGHVVEEITAQ